MTETLETALERAAQPREVKTIYDLLDRERPQLEKKLPRGIGWDWMEGAIRNELRRVPGLLACDPNSLAGAVVFCASVGLAPGPLGHAYMWPAGHEVVVTFGYKGYIELAFRSGQVKDIKAGVVHEGDMFAYREGTRPFLDHTPAGPRADRPMTHAYAVARLRTGGAPFVVLFPEDIEAAKKRSQLAAKGKGPWHEPDFYWSMVLKTPIRRLARYLPQSPQWMTAMARDDQPVPVNWADEPDESGAAQADVIEADA